MGGRGSGGGGVVAKGKAVEMPKATKGEINEVLYQTPGSAAKKFQMLTTLYGLTPSEATAALKDAGLL